MIYIYICVCVQLTRCTMYNIPTVRPCSIRSELCDNFKRLAGFNPWQAARRVSFRRAICRVLVDLAGRFHHGFKAQFQKLLGMSQPYIQVVFMSVDYGNPPEKHLQDDDFSPRISRCPTSSASFCCQDVPSWGIPGDSEAFGSCFSWTFGEHVSGGSFERALAR